MSADGAAPLRPTPPPSHHHPPPNRGAAALGDKPTGVWLEELAAPYLAFRAAGHDVTVATVAGGAPPVDPASEGDGFFTPDCAAFRADADAQRALAAAPALADLDGADFACVFLPGGHGTCVDFWGNAAVASFVRACADAGGVVASVCHGALGLVDGVDLAGKNVTCFSNEEEEAVGLTSAVPALCETALVDRGGIYTKAAEAWASAGGGAPRTPQPPEEAPRADASAPPDPPADRPTDRPLRRGATWWSTDAW